MGSFLATALSYVQRRDTEEDTSLTAGMAIPSHEEVEFESPAHGNPEVDLLPVTTLALDHRVEDDSDSECGDLEGQLALPGVGESSGEEDSLDLEPSMGPVMSMVTSSVTSVTSTASSGVAPVQPWEPHKADQNSGLSCHLTPFWLLP